MPTAKQGRIIGNFFDRHDMFSSAVPAFNIEGQEQVGTRIGCFFSIIMTVFILSVGSFKAMVLVTRKNPGVAQYLLEDAFSKNFTIDLNDLSFAFYVHDADTNEPLDDPNHVEWSPMLMQDDPHGKNYMPIPFHKCSDEEFEEMPHPTKNQREKYEWLKNEKRMYCLNHRDQFGELLHLNLRGGSSSHNHTFLSIMYRPCIPTQRTEQNKDTGTCLVNDLTD